MIQLEGLAWHMAWMSYIGAVKGCLEYLEQPTSLGWLYGGTGNAFVLCIHEELCPSGPTAWGDGKTGMALGRNVGYALDGVSMFRGQPEFEDGKKKAWATIRAGIDAGLPALGWELNIPEFYVITGYDDVGYYYSGPQEGGPKPWQELGETEIGWLEAAVLSTVEPADDQQVVKDALQFAVAIAQTPNQWIHEGYHSGLDAYDQWIKALQTNTADGFGMAYNSEVWAEAREQAVAFLQEARGRLGSHYAGLIDEAIGHYTIVKGMLRQVANLYPFHDAKPEHIQDEGRRVQACTYLGPAHDAERAGLAALARLAKAL